MDWSVIIAAAISVIAGPVIYNITRHKKALLTQTLMYGQRVGVRVWDGRYVQANFSDDTKLVATVRHVREWEIFEIVKASDPFSPLTDTPVRYGDAVAFRANNLCFVGAALDPMASQELFARVPWVKAWETFVLICPPEHRCGGLRKVVRHGSFFALQAANKKYVIYNHDGDLQLSATSADIQEWETFVFVDPTNPK